MCLRKDESKWFLKADTIAFIWPLFFKNDSQSLYCVNDVCAHLGELKCLEVVMTDKCASSSLPKHKVCVCLGGHRGWCSLSLWKTVGSSPTVTGSYFCVLEQLQTAVSFIKTSGRKTHGCFYVWITTYHHTHTHTHIYVQALSHFIIKHQQQTLHAMHFRCASTDFILLRRMNLKVLLSGFLFHLYSIS